jgi:uncharacterized protein (TIGR02246 family)
MHRILAVFLAGGLLATAVNTGCRSSSFDEDDAQIRAVMDAQLAAWNRGDIDGFLEGYIKSPDLIFASRGTFARGWDPLLERYKVAYPTGNMGTLRFDGVEIHPMGEDHAWVIGSWYLDLADTSPHGAFTLVFQKTDDGWKIIHDHSSGVDVPEQE